MRKWEFVLQERYEQDRLRLLDYREIDLEFKEWLIKLLYEGVEDKHERSEHRADDDTVHDHRIRDRECVRTEQDQVSDPGPDLTFSERPEIGAAEERLAAMIAAEPEETYEVSETSEPMEDIYDSLYDEIAEYRVQRKVGPKKKKHKRK